MNSNYETLTEMQNNDELVAMLLNRRVLYIPNRDIQGNINPVCPVVVAEVDWHCPVCNAIMGEPQLYRMQISSLSFYVSTWQNPCGHDIKYADLKPKSVLPEFYKKGE